jgi:superfamily I DNA/RNA helicase
VEVATFVDYAMAILTNHRGPIRLVERPEQQAIVEGLLTVEGRDEWPTLHDHLHHVSFAEEVATTVLHYQSAFLAAGTLREYAAAADATAAWDELHAFTERYIDALDARRAVDTAGALVQASLLLTDDAVLTDERQRYAALLVDDYELATVGVESLLLRLAREGGELTVSGNPEAEIQAVHGASATHLELFGERFGAATDLSLTTSFRSTPQPWLVTGERIDESVAIAEKLETARTDGFSWSDMAVLTRRELDARSLASRLPRGFTVATIDGAGGLEWPVVVIAGCTEGSLPATYPHHGWFDPLVLGGPTTPSHAEREDAWVAEEERRFRLATTRATSRLVLVAPQPASRFVTT